jgi:hypothetical protein
MAKTAADFMLERLRQWGVERIYGYPGDGINGILGALGRHEDRSSSCRRATKRWPRSWPAGTPTAEAIELALANSARRSPPPAAPAPERPRYAIGA